MDIADETLPAQLAFLLAPHTGRQEVAASEWGPASTADTTSSASLELGATVVRHQHTSHREDGTVFEVLNLFLRDTATGEVLLYAFDSLGYPPDPPARGGWVDGDLVLDRTSPRGSSRTVFTPTPGGYRWSKSFRRDEGDPWQLVFTDELART